MSEPETSNQKPETVAAPEPTPPGWWKLANLHGTRDAVCRAIEQSAAPKPWQAALIAEIRALDPKFNMVTLDAHFMVESGHSAFHLKIKPSSALI